KMVPWFRLKNSSHRCRLMPGVGIWLPSRYTANSPRVNSTRFRRSGMRKTFASASKNFMIVSLPCGSWLPGANHLSRTAGSLDLLQGRFGKQMGRDVDLASQLARAEDLQPIANFANDA